MWFAHFARGQQKFCSFNFANGEECENRSIVKITIHTVASPTLFRLQEWPLPSERAYSPEKLQRALIGEQVSPDTELLKFHECAQRV